MHAIILIKDLEIENVIIKDTFASAVDRAINIAANYDLFNRYDDEEERKSVKSDFYRHGEFEKDNFKITIVRAFR